MNKNVIIVGAGGHSQVIKEIIEQNNDTVLGYLDDCKTGNDILGKTNDIIKFYEQNSRIEFFIAIGNNEIRNKIYKSNNVKYYTAIHTKSIISPNAKIGEGSLIMAGAVINTDSEIGCNCIINTNCIVEHNCKINDGAHLSYGAIIGADCIIGEKAYIGAGAIIDRNTKIEDLKIVEIGAIVRGEEK